MKRKTLVVEISAVFLIVLGSVGSAGAQVTVSIPDIEGAPGEEISIAVEVDDAAGIAGVDITLEFDSTILTCTGAEVTSLADGFLFMSNCRADDVLVSLASPVGIQSGSGPLVVIHFEVAGDISAPVTTPLVLSRVLLHNDAANPIPSIAQDGEMRIAPPMELLSPLDGIAIPCESGVTFQWTPGRNDRFQVQLSVNNFSTVLKSSPILSTTSWPMPTALWTLMPRTGMVLYWRVRGANSGDDPLDIEFSTEVRTFTKATTGISLIAPPDGSELTAPTTFTWTPGCNNFWRLQLSRDDFASVVWQSPNLTSPQYDITPIWGAIPDDATTTIYWRAIGVNTGEYTLFMDTSNARTFRKVSP